MGGFIDARWEGDGGFYETFLVWFSEEESGTPSSAGEHALCL